MAVVTNSDINIGVSYVPFFAFFSCSIVLHVS